MDGCEHGTHVAGIVAGKNGLGGTLNGIAKDANILSIQVFSKVLDSGQCGGTAPCISAFDSDIIKGLERVYELKTDTQNPMPIASVNLSLGDGSQYTTYCDATKTAMKTAIDNLRSEGVATIIASGNESYTNGISSPACISTAVSVGATTKSNAVAAYSNSSALLGLLAPGSSIASAIPGNNYASMSGTSMAAPHVAGAWALMKQINPNASVDTILNAFKQKGVGVEDTRNSVTKPRIDIGASVHKITVNASGNGSGTVSTTPSSRLSFNYNADNTGNALFIHGDDVYANAILNVGSLPAWTDCESVGGMPFTLSYEQRQCRFSSLSGDKTLNVTFTLNTWTVGAGSDPVEGGTISCTPSTVNHGSQVTCTVTPNVGYSILSVVGVNGTLVGNTYTTGPITSNSFVLAVFTLNAYTISTTINPFGGGGISCNATSVQHGGQTTCSVGAFPGYVLQSVTGCGGTLNGDTYTTGPITSNCTITANFTPVGNGQCGSANGQTLLVAPTSNLCNAGTPTQLDDHLGEWWWDCKGSNGGSDAHCSAGANLSTLSLTLLGDGAGKLEAVTSLGIGGIEINYDYATSTWPIINQDMHGRADVSVVFTATAEPGSTAKFLDCTKLGGVVGGNQSIATCTFNNSYMKSLITSFSKVFDSSAIDNAVDNPGLTWTSSGDANWYVQPDRYIEHYGNYPKGNSVIRSGAILGNQESCLSTTVTGPKILSFYWRPYSEYGENYLKFYINDELIDQVNGGMPEWENKIFSLTTGNNNLKWCFEKVLSYDALTGYTDMGWIDNVILYDSILTINKSGAGKVTSDIGSIDCGDKCNGYYKSGNSSVTLTATPVGIAAFQGWGDDCSSCGSNPTCNINVTTSKTCSAEFTAISVPAFGSTINSNPNGLSMWDNIYYPYATMPATGLDTDINYYAGDFLLGDFSKMYLINPVTNKLETIEMYSFLYPATVTENPAIVTEIGSITPANGHSWTGLTASLSGKMYIASFNRNNLVSKLYEINPQNAALTYIGDITGNCISDIAHHPTNGFIYGTDICNDKLVKINPQDATKTEIGSGLGFYDTNTLGQGIDFDDVAGVLYWAVHNPTTTEFRFIDIESGTSSKISDLGQSVKIGAFATATYPTYPITISINPPNTGDISCDTMDVGHKHTTNCYVIPFYGYGVQSVTGCGGTYNSTDRIYTTGLITGNCTITGNFIEVTNGECGSAHDQLTATIPTSNLCNVGNPTQVATNTGFYSWNCNSPDGGENASCTAPRGYIVTPTVNGSGSINPNTPQMIEYNTTTQFTVTPDANYVIQSVSGCGGTLVGNTYTTGAITGNCTVTANFTGIPINGQCGSANGQTLLVAPTSNLCDIGNPTQVTDNPLAPQWIWQCTGVNGGTNASCSANWQMLSFSVKAEGDGRGLATSPQHFLVKIEYPTPFGNDNPKWFTSRYHEGVGVQFVAKAATGSTLAWTTCEDIGGTVTGDNLEATCSFPNRTANKATVVTFTANKYTVTGELAIGQTVADGTITPASTQVSHGDITSFTVIPNTANNKILESITGDCGGTLSGYIYTTSPITKNCTVTAKFKDKEIVNPDIFVSTSALNFGEVIINQTSEKSVVIKNTGGANLIIGNITKSVDVNFVILSDFCSGKSITPGNICTFKVAFTPKVAGDLTAAITIPHNAGDAKTIDLSGRGFEEAKPMISVSPSTINYAMVNPASSVSTVVVIKNTGNSLLTIFGVNKINGDKFTISENTCLYTQAIAAGNTCQFKVVYTPNGNGTHTGLINIVSNALNVNVYSLDLIGTTSAPENLQVETDKGSFLGVVIKDETYIDKNNLRDSAGIEDFVVTKAVEFQLGGLSNAGTDSITVTITFDSLPSNPIIIKRDRDGNMKQIYPKTEIDGISNVNLDIVNRTLTFTIKDNSNADIDATAGNIKDPVIVGNGNEVTKYTLTVNKTGSGTVTSNPAGINCGSTCSADFNEETSVVLTATASSGYTFGGWSGSGCSGTGTCTIVMSSAKSVTATFNQNSTPPPPPPPTPNCTYTIDPTSKNFTYQSGSGTVAITKNAGTCNNDNWTAVSNDNWITVTAGSSGSGNGTVSYIVSSNISTTSNRTGTITIAGNTFTVTQGRMAGKIISVSPASVNFGSVKSGVRVTKQVTISNLGTETITISNVAITGADASKFAVNNPCSTILAGSSCIVTATYYASNPANIKISSSIKSLAAHTATMGIISNATNSSTVNVVLTGTTNDSVNPQISVTPTQINQALDIEFGNSFGLVVTNPGSGLLTIEQVMIQGRDKGEFGVRNLCTDGIEANQDCRILITTNFSSYSNKEVSISIISNATNNSKLEIPIRLTSRYQCDINLDKTNATYSAKAGSGIVTVTMDNQDCLWRVDTDVNWITVDKSWRKGYGNVSFTINANTTGAVRMGKIQIGGRIFTVIQANSISSAAGQVLSNFSIFSDTAGSIFENYINALYANGLTTGCSSNPLMYCPSNTVTRETGAVFMIRGIEGNPTSNYCDGSSPFIDVDVNATWSCGHIKRLMERGITYGCNSPSPNQAGTMFCPASNMNRWQMAVMIIRALYGENFSYSATPYFSDVDVTDIGFKYVQKLKDVGITKAEGLFYPYRDLSREEMSAFLSRAFLSME